MRPLAEVPATDISTERRTSGSRGRPGTVASNLPLAVPQGDLLGGVLRSPAGLPFQPGAPSQDCGGCDPASRRAVKPRVPLHAVMTVFASVLVGRDRCVTLGDFWATVASTACSWWSYVSTTPTSGRLPARDGRILGLLSLVVRVSHIHAGRWLLWRPAFRGRTRPLCLRGETARGQWLLRRGL